MSVQPLLYLILHIIQSLNNIIDFEKLNDNRLFDRNLT